MGCDSSLLFFDKRDKVLLELTRRRLQEWPHKSPPYPYRWLLVGSLLTCYHKQQIRSFLQPHLAWFPLASSDARSKDRGLLASTDPCRTPHNSPMSSMELLL